VKIVKAQLERSSSYNRKNHIWKKAKLLAKSRLSRSQIISKWLIVSWKYIINFALSVRYKIIVFWNFISGQYCDSIDPEKTVWISPDTVVYTGLREFDFQKYKGSVIGGSWDLLENRFSDLDVYNAIKQVCCDKDDWPNTLFYQRTINNIIKGEVHWGCQNQHDFDDRCQNIEKLFYSIKISGYKTQRDLLPQSCNDIRKLEDEITVSIGRKGDLLFSNSAHRLAIAKLIGLKKIPVKVSSRHPQWVSFVQRVNVSVTKSSITPTHEFSHPDLRALPSSRYCESAYTLIRDELTVQQGLILDLGARFGHICQHFQSDGFNCYASELDSCKLDNLKIIKSVERYEFTVIDSPILNINSIRGQYFNSVIALSCLHKLLNDSRLLSLFIEFVKTLDTNTFFYQPINSKNLDTTVDAGGDYDKIIESILNYTDLNKLSLVGFTDNKLPLYKLSKQV